MKALGRIKSTLAAAALAIVVSACATTATTPDSQVTEIKPPATIESQTNSAATSTPAQVKAHADSLGYKLGNGDTLRITVFGEPDLSGEFQVDGTGMISLPLIGEIAASGKSVRQVQRAMEELFRSGYLNDPRISAEVINFRPYYILGEVSRPGEYPYSDGLTVLNAIATAEGYTYRANKKVIFVRGADQQEEREVKLTSSTRVQPGDTLRIGERLF